MVCLAYKGQPNLAYLYVNSRLRQYHLIVFPQYLIIITPIIAATALFDLLVEVALVFVEGGVGEAQDLGVTIGDGSHEEALVFVD